MLQCCSGSIQKKKDDNRSSNLGRRMQSKENKHNAKQTRSQQNIFYSSEFCSKEKVKLCNNSLYKNIFNDVEFRAAFTNSKNVKNNLLSGQKNKKLKLLFFWASASFGVCIVCRKQTGVEDK